VKRLKDRTPEEQEWSERLSAALRGARRGWDHFTDLANARDRLRTMGSVDLEKIGATEAMMTQRAVEIDQFEAEANRYLHRLGERPLRTERARRDRGDFSL
jgi:hypothetical protein